MSQAKRWIVVAMLVVCAWTSARAQDTDVIRINTALVTVNISVLNDRGRHLPGLQAKDFLVTDEGQTVLPDFFDGQGPASIVLVIDISSSMQPKWTNLSKALKKFLGHADAKNDYTLIAFNERARVVARSVGAGEFLQQFKTLKPFGETAVYDAVLLGLNTLQRTPQRHRALVVLSDGQDNCSHAGLALVQQEFLAQRATIYTVGMLLDPHDHKSYEESGRELLNQLANATGGLVHFPDPERIAEALDSINEDLSHQYSLSYHAPEQTTGWRHIQVNLTQDQRRLKLRYQQRYLMR